MICDMDDILVHGQDKRSHATALLEVFRKLQESGLTLNSAKCEIAKSSLTLVGHVIDDSGVRPDPSKIKSIEKFPTPTQGGPERAKWDA